MTVRILHGDALEQLRTLAAESVHSIVTDPPYELVEPRSLVGFGTTQRNGGKRTEEDKRLRRGGFMGKAWDATGIAHNVEVWIECLRVLKPGGHLLSFGGSRTYHRMACAIEDAGFEIRDQIMWVFGQGFPKSLDVSKAIDKARDDLGDIYKVAAWLREQRDRAGWTNRQLDEAFGFKGVMVQHWMALPRKGGAQCPKWGQWLKLKALLGFGDEMDEEVWRLNGRKGTPGENWEKRKKVGDGEGAGSRGNTFPLASEYDLTAPATQDAERWQGWGTALKPAHEPIVVARKPLIGTVAANILKFGTGALNIDGCRVRAENRESGDGVSREENCGRRSADELRGVRESNAAMALASASSEAADGLRSSLSFKGDDGGWQPQMDGWDLGGHAERVSLAENGLALGVRSGPAIESGIAASARTSNGDGADSWPSAVGIGDGASHQRSQERQPSGEPSSNELVGALEGASVNRARTSGTAGGEQATADTTGHLGRWPANVITDGSDEVLAAFPESNNSGNVRCEREANSSEFFFGGKANTGVREFGDSGSAARFFYTAKAAADDRNTGSHSADERNHHPTVKPTDLMQYLVRLVTPPGGTVLDPFAGSGSTGIAADREGFDAILIEREAEYVEIARRRIVGDCPLFADLTLGLPLDITA